jgi:hypothetical protein
LGKDYAGASTSAGRAAVKQLLYALIAATALSASAYAVPITFTLSGLATGNANGVPFTAEPFTITYSSDTSFMLPNDTVEVYPQEITSFSIFGIGSGTFTHTFYLNWLFGASFVNLTDTMSGNNFLLIYPGLLKEPFAAAFGPISVLLDPKTPLPSNLGSSLGNITLRAWTT